MPIDIHGERLLTLSQAARALPKKIAPSTLWRWYRKGVRGVVLETVVVGGARYTSAEAIQRFATALTALGRREDAVSLDKEDSNVRSAAMESQLRTAGLC